MSGLGGLVGIGIVWKWLPAPEESGALHAPGAVLSRINTWLGGESVKEEILPLLVSFPAPFSFISRPHTHDPVLLSH